MQESLTRLHLHASASRRNCPEPHVAPSYSHVLALFHLFLCFILILAYILCLEFNSFVSFKALPVLGIAAQLVLLAASGSIAERNLKKLRPAGPEEAQLGLLLPDFDSNYRELKILPSTAFWKPISNRIHRLRPSRIPADIIQCTSRSQPLALPHLPAPLSFPALRISPVFAPRHFGAPLIDSSSLFPFPSSFSLPLSTVYHVVHLQRA